MRHTAQAGLLYGEELSVMAMETLVNAELMYVKRPFAMLIEIFDAAVISEVLT